MDILIKIQSKSTSILAKYIATIILFTIFSVIVAIRGNYILLALFSKYVYVPLLFFFVLIVIYDVLKYKKIEKEELYKQLQAYLSEKNPNCKLYIDLSDKRYNAGAAKDKYVVISKGWYDYAKEQGDSSFVKATICHELYHIILNHPFFKESLKHTAVYTFGLRGRKKKNEYIVESWKEELEADLFGYAICDNQDVYLEKMRFMKENTSLLRKKVTDHPAWEMRIRYLEEEITPSWGNVERDFREVVC